MDKAYNINNGRNSSVKLNEIFFVSPQPGTYVGLRLSDKTTKQFVDYIKQNKIPNSVAKTKLHATVLYSRVPVECEGKVPVDWTGTFQQFDSFKETAGDSNSTNCLVVKFVCPEINKQHEECRSKGGTHDFDSFDPHITLSYDIGTLDFSSLPAIDFPIVFKELYSEPLDLSAGC